MIRELLGARCTRVRCSWSQRWKDMLLFNRVNFSKSDRHSEYHRSTYSIVILMQALTTSHRTHPVSSASDRSTGDGCTIHENRATHTADIAARIARGQRWRVISIHEYMTPRAAWFSAQLGVARLQASKFALGICSALLFSIIVRNAGWNFTYAGSTSSPKIPAFSCIQSVSPTTHAFDYITRETGTKLW